MASLVVSPTVQTGSTISAGTSTSGLRPDNRTFSLTGVLGTSIQKGDVVDIWGSNDGGRTFQPLRVAENEIVRLTYYNPECVINDACDTYATQRVAVGAGSTLTAVGFNGETVYVNPSPAWVQGGNSGFAPRGILGTTDAVPFRIIAQGVDIFDSDGVTTALGNLEASVPASSLQLFAGSGGAQWAVDSTGSLDLQTDLGTIFVSSQRGNIDMKPGATAAVRLLARAAGAGDTTPLQFFNLAGTRFVSFKAADAIGVNITWTLPATDAAGVFTSDGTGVVSIVPPVKANFSAAASLTNAAAQFVAPSAQTTSLTVNRGVLQANAGAVSRFFVSIVGDAANVAGQTITAEWQLNGVAIVGASIAGLATNAGTHANNVILGVPVALVPGDILTMTITPSAALTAVVTNVTGAAA